MLIEIAMPRDLAPIAVLLQEAALPSGDLDAAKLAHFLVLRSADARALAGAIGFEPHGTIALLRSLVVSPAQRGSGVGATLVGAVEARARKFGIGELFLLTTTAEAFFARLGYTRVARESAPVALQSTAEFAALCPASAVCMRKTL